MGHIKAGPFATGVAPALNAGNMNIIDSQYDDAYAVFGTKVDTEYATLELAVAATPVGGVLEVRSAWTRSTTWTISQAMTVRFRGGSITQTTDTHGIDVTADNVTIEYPNVIGIGASVAGSAAGIRCVGTFASPRSNFTVRGGVVDGWRKHGIYLEQINNFQVIDVTTRNLAYAGIIVLSGTQGIIRGNTVTNLTQPSGFVNSYGIALTRDSSANISVAPRTSSVVVDGNTVTGVTLWEGIDTHGGSDLTIVNNKVYNCNIGIAMVPCPDTGGTDTYAPIGIIIAGNTIDSQQTDGSRQQGIKLVGAGTVGAPVENATGVITGNIIRNHGVEGTAGTGGGIQTLVTAGVVVANNRIVNGGFCGIQVYHTNTNMVVSHNTFVDVWSNTAAVAAAVYVRSTNNTVLVQGNALLTGGKSATLLNKNGINAATVTSNVVTDGGGNDWSIATASVAGVTGIIKMGFFGTNPIAKPTLAAAATDAATTQTLANSLRTTLIALGLTS